MKLFLTGGSGYLGGVLAHELARSPEIESITAIDVTPPKAPLPDKVRFTELDIRSPELASKMAGHDVVVNTALVLLWSAKMPRSERDDINHVGVRHVAEAAHNAGVRRFVHASSMAAYDFHQVQGGRGITEDAPLGTGTDAYSYYWSAKAKAEHAITEVFAGAQTLLTVLRPIYIIGPRNTATVPGLRKNAVNFIGRDPSIQFVHEDDVAAAFLKAATSDLPGAFNVVPDDAITLREVWRAVGKRSVPTVPVWLARTLLGARWRFFGSPVHPSWIEDTLADMVASNAKLRATGWAPRYKSLEALTTAL